MSLLSVVAAGLTVVAPTASADPTMDDGRAFAQEVYDSGVLDDFLSYFTQNPKAYQNLLNQLLLNICDYRKSGYATKNYVVSQYMKHPYNLSEDDASWLVETASDHCN
ncbi:MAG: hypothetical protein QG671_1612 [Actinomycetota bacterium]|jgi:hypothetical protein|nr:hypothetical protein [Actinomycetota bacterium]